MAAAKKRGRPTKRTPNIEQQVLDRLSKGEPLTVICRDLKVSDRTVRDWTSEDNSFSADIASARARGYDAIALECLDIADETSQDTIMVGPADNQRESANSEWIARSKLRVETRLKLLAKWDPKRYGDLVKLSGADGTSPVQALTVSFVAPGQEAK